ncbi:MAG TPA: hypothetical protein DCM07_25050, partial [Planctomycetaceae bacterium]|nr:hypothetical protein [Planctomycetaceae bacterium]
EPFRILEITFDKSDQIITLPNLSRLNHLLTLHSFNMMSCNLKPGALDGLHFNDSLTDLHIYNTPLKTADLTATMGLEHLDTFRLGAIQVNDRFQFLKLMPHLRDLHLYSPVQRALEDLASSTEFSQTNLRFLNFYTYGWTFSPATIQALQKVHPGMSVINNDASRQKHYQGIPVARQAANKLLNQGCTIKSLNPVNTFHKSQYPSETELFFPGRVTLPPDLVITREIVEALSQLPPFYGLTADGVKNADLLSEIPVVKLCSGVHLADSDLTDRGFEAFIRNHPDGYVHVEGTRVTREKAEQMHHKFRYAAFHTDYLEGKRWLAIRQKTGDPKPDPNEPTNPDPETSDAGLSDSEREFDE